MNNRKGQTEIPAAILKRWWWRRLVFVRFDEETHTTQRRAHVPEYPSYGFSGEWNMWHRKDELIAFRFELLRRTSFPDLPEWYAIPASLEGWVRGVLAPRPGRAVCGIFAPTAPSGYASLGDWMWDLTASDDSLCRFFLLQINEERRKRGLPQTNDPFAEIVGSRQKHEDKRRGDRNRHVSWLAVEAHDIQSFGIRPLTDGERSRLSKARREAAMYEEPLKIAVAHAHQHSQEAGGTAPGEDKLYSRFIRENFLQRSVSRIQKR